MRAAAIGQGCDGQSLRCASLFSRRMPHRCTASRSPRPDGNAPRARFRASQAARERWAVPNFIFPGFQNVTMNSGCLPAGKGEPDMGVSAPVAPSNLKPEIFAAPSLAT